MATTTEVKSASEILQRYMAAEAAGDVAGALALFDEGFVMEWPQSGERFTGPQDALAAISAAEVKPEPVGPPRILGDGAVGVVMMPLKYGDELSHYVGVYEIADGRITHATEYFGAPFAAQAARSAFADRDGDA